MPILKLSRLEFKEAIKPFLLFGKNSSVLPILDNAILTFSGDMEIHHTSVRATNLEYDIEIFLDPKNTGDGFTILLPYRKVYNFLLNADGGEVIIEPNFEKTRCKISCGDMSMEFNMEDAQFYVKSTILSPVKGYIVSSAVLANDLKTAAKFVSNDELRPSMTFINMCEWNSKTYMVATDAHKLFFRKLNLDYCGYDFLLKKTLGSFISEVFKIEEPIVLSRYEKYNVITGHMARIAIKNPDEKYVEWKAVLPMDDVNEVFVNRKRLEAILKFVASVTDNLKQTKFQFGKDIVKISSEDTFGDNLLVSESTIPVLKTNQETDFQVGFNCKFLLDAASTKKEDLVKFTHSGKAYRCVVINNEVLIMPVMLNNNF